MRQKTSKWFEVKVAYDKNTENGELKRVIELYAVEAMSFAEAESRITEETASYSSGEFMVKTICIPQYAEAWFSDNIADDKFYKAKIQFHTIDEATGKEKVSNVFYLVQAGNFDTAKKYVEEAMKGSMADCNIAYIKETNITEVFEKK